MATGLSRGDDAAPAAVRSVAPEIPLWVVGLVFWSVVGAVLAARAAGLAEIPAVTTLGVIFTSIVIEALPFILIGALVSAAIAVFVPEAAFARLARLPRALQLPGAAVAGVAFPVCECGSVPVARRLLVRGLDPAAGVAFMLAAPILNPIVLASTWVAYQGHGRALEMTAARAGFGLLAAVLAGLVITRLAGGQLLRATGERPPEHARQDARAAEFSRHLADDFFFMARYLILGAAASAVLQTVLPQSFVSGVGGTPVLAPLTMVGIAFALSLCSEADAFVAVSFTAFPLGPQLAFLIAGPMLDTKLAVLYGATFRRNFVPLLALVVIPVAVAGSLFIEALL
jgi:uncharacterized membrane protein YraQ (UPF0718 family)